MFSQPGAADDGGVRGGARRILDAAIELFGRQGVQATSLKQIAAEAATSPALIVHHFGSKDGLRAACDEHVAAVIRERKRQALAQGASIDPMMLGAYDEYRPLLRFLARTLIDGSPHVNDLIDELAADAQAYTAEAVEGGIVLPSRRPRDRVVVLLLWSLGAVVLHEHFERLMGVDLLGSKGPPLPYVDVVLEIMGGGILAPGTYEHLHGLQASDIAAPATAPRSEPHEGRHQP